MNNSRYLFILTVMSFLLFACGNIFRLADLRTLAVKQDQNTAKAKQLLAAMAKAHGAENWSSIETYTVRLEDQFYGFLGKQSSPYGTDSVVLQLDYRTGTFDGRMSILNGKKEGELWGIQSWRTYVKKPGGSLSFKKNKEAEFWLPTYQYFIEFPQRIQSATAIAYAGQQLIDGIPCTGILASWNTVNPQKDLDQYLIWISDDKQRIVKLEYTIRDQYKFLTGSVLFQDYQIYEGIWLPRMMPVTSNLKGKGKLHQMRILNFQKDQVGVEELRPDNTLPLLGDAKATN